MVVLVDANVILDVLQERQPFLADSERILRLCAERTVTGVIAAHTIPTMFYVLRKFYPQDELRAALLNVCGIFVVSPLTADKITAALKNNAFTDFEDNLQEECAVERTAACIITRNPKDFKNARIPALLPDDFLKQLEKSQQSM